MKMSEAEDLNNGSFKVDAILRSIKLKKSLQPRIGNMFDKYLTVPK